jgi:hypothetical protein
MNTLVAIGEALAEGRTLAAAERRALIDHIEERARRPEYLSMYRASVSTLDQLAGAPLTALGIDERIALIVRHRLVGPPTSSGDEREAVRRLRVSLVPDLIRGYYASPAGWHVVRYDVFPGRCGDLTRYTRAET